MKRAPIYIGILLTNAALTSSAIAQTLGRGGDDSVSFWRVAGALIVCIALGIGAALFLRARGGALPAIPKFLVMAGKQRRLELVEVLRLNQHVDLCLVRCDGETMLLAASSQGIDVLPRFGAADQACGSSEQGR